MKGPRVTEIVQKINFEGRVRIKKKIPETITHKVSETNSSFHMK